MSIQQQITGLDARVEDIAEEITRSTYPGPENDGVKRGLMKANAVFPVVVEDLRDWFYAVDVRVYGEDHIGIPMRYRWTIIRWAQQDMDHWLESHGWEDAPHRNADSYSRREDELEARYRKEYSGVTVDCNFLVHIPRVVFEKLNENSSKNMMDRKRQRDKKSASLEEVIEARRS